MTYKEYRDKTQAEFNALPLFFALTNDQFKREMEREVLQKMIQIRYSTVMERFI